MGTEKFIAFKEDGTAYRLKGRILRFLDNEPVSEADKTNIRSTLSVPASGEGLTPANNLSDLSNVATARTNLGVNGIAEDAQANALKVTAPALYFNGSSSVVTVADDDKLTFSSLTEFGKTTAGTWSPEDNTPALTDGTGTLDDHYKIDADGTVAQGGSTLSIIDGASVTAGQVVYYDGSVWRVKDCDDLPFSISVWLKFDDSVTNQGIVTKYGGSSAVQEWTLITGTTGKLDFSVKDTSGNYERVVSSDALTDYIGEWIHIAASYAGAGPSAASGNAFTSAADGMKFYLNGSEITTTESSIGTYTGMSNTTQPIWIGRSFSSTFSFEGSIRDAKIFNKELTADEVAQLARGNDLGFSEEWGGAFGTPYTADWSSTTDSWSASNTTLSQASGPLVGRTNFLQITANAGSSTHAGKKTISGVEVGKRYRVVFDYWMDATNSNADGIKARFDNGTYQPLSATTGAWTRYEFEAVATSNILEIYMFDGASQTFDDTGGDDNLWVDNLTVTAIGCLSDFRSEDYNESASKLLDRSSNNFVGVGTSVTLTGNQRHISADTIDLKNLPTSSAGLSAGEVWSNGGVLTVV